MTNPLSNPNDILRAVENSFKEVYKPGVLYRATGVTLANLIDTEYVQKDLFGGFKQIDKWTRVFGTLDSINSKFGGHAILLGSSLKAKEVSRGSKRSGSKTDPKSLDLKKKLIILNINSKNKLEIPFRGRVS